MGQRLDGKIAIITGSGRGIGKSTALLFLKENATVIATDKDLEPLQETYASLQSDGALVEFYQVDITNKQQFSEVVSKVIERYGRVDILINNAGMNVFDDPLTMDDDQWEKCHQINLKGAWNCSQTVLPYFVKQNYGNIVNIASVHGHKIIKGCFPYPVFKHGLIGLTKSLAIEYAANDIRVNSISPGLIMTPAIDAYFAAQDDPEKEKTFQRELLPCKRIGEPEEVAFTALFLASDEARYINATDIKIDGGRSQVYHD